MRGPGGLRLGLAFPVVDIPQSGLLAKLFCSDSARGIQARFLLSAMQPALRLLAQPLLANGACRRLRCFSAGGITVGLAIFEF